MGTLINGIKDIFSTSKTTATHLPVCASDGTPQGRISVGDLANVLGDIYLIKGQISNIDINTLKINGAYRTVSGITNLPSNLSSVEGVLVVNDAVFTSGNHTVTVQTFFSHATNTMYIRHNWYNVWQPWQEVTINMPTFYKNYADLSSLATALGGVGEPTRIIQDNNVTDMNNVLGVRERAYIHFISTTDAPSNLPDTFVSGTRFFVQVLNVSDFYIEQIVYDHGSRIYLRSGRGSGGAGSSINWSSWKEL